MRSEWIKVKRVKGMRVWDCKKKKGSEEWRRLRMTRNLKEGEGEQWWGIRWSELKKLKKEVSGCVILMKGGREEWRGGEEMNEVTEEN